MTAKILSADTTLNVDFNMDYRQIFYLFCDDNDLYNIMGQIKQLNRNNSDYNPVSFHTTTEIELSMPFYVTGGAHYEVGDHYYTRRAHVQTYQLIYTCSGNGIVQIGEKRYDCKKGSMLLVNCQEEHSYCTQKGEVWNYKHIHFTPQEDCLSLVEFAKTFFPFSEDAFEKYIDKIFDETKHFNVNSAYLISNYISTILTEMIVFRSQTNAIHPHLKMITGAAVYMENHYMDKINVNDLAKNEFISVFYFTRLFKEHYGTSPYDYLIKIRINKSKAMLAQGSSIKEVASKCGFGNTNNYLRIFKKYIGVAPNQFRSEHYHQTDT